MSSVTFVHLAAKAVVRNEIPFGRDTHAVTSSKTGPRPGPHNGKGRFGGWKLELQIRSDATHRQITLFLLSLFSFFVITQTRQQTETSAQILSARVVST